ncbi:hypothetical protein B0J13DRAFT_572373 [Dactylonectria estremocensis]|uniref:Uncharacterized protein n=1 Tax=Dactylonectria estremocensis TaxID=1079267 RepID=A0A9P9IC31_9HYPO|nr:hypothetical protein B0J13DRAFT_572373 [Dactylonectria estremocensis]
MAAATKPDIASLLGQSAFSAAECESALQGRTPLPQQLGNSVVRLCLVSGLRRHVTLARSAEMAELCTYEGQEVFTRARNARLIMSNEVPAREQMMTAATQPYCIWHPDVAREETYRRVAEEFPGMRYQVGRACAVAGYARLYHELDLLPDPSIAEEAREAAQAGGIGKAGSREIYESIMAAPMRYAVMNDYNVTIELDMPPPGALLNADTAVRASLEARSKYHQHFRSWHYFNITEDWGIGLEKVELGPAKLMENEVELLAAPLPADLPTMNKDLLILAAAYEGNVDRYARLRRPGCSVPYELHCLVPGVHRSTAMAMWLARNPDIMKVVADHWDSSMVVALRRAIHARHVMNNSISRLLPDATPFVPHDELPYWIWYPTLPSPHIMCELAQARPAMRSQCARACVAGNHQWAYTKIMDMPGEEEGDADGASKSERIPLASDPFLQKEAESSGNREFYVSDLKRRRAELGLPPRPSRRIQDQEWKLAIPWQVGDTSSAELLGFLQDSGSSVVHVGQDWGMWECLGAELGRVRLHLSSQPEAIARARKEEGGGGC